ncbi:Uma2 family endonuclease [Fodinisporobacter ferrooxydans]|uniref:Uma2 family endonuclease n=1 Tax=Fodinisporobacter ferrooxydans TaxID=2901836 RepID=A0ABY4CS41_9BACL|nr:Uma2 family endonuclease [Alicyclobacillaceae bacterium MYW30-H2]
MSVPMERQQRMFTYKDYMKWSDEERWELIRGVPYNMTPAPSRKHQEIVGELYRVLGNYLEGKSCRAFIAPFDVRLALAEESDEDVENVIQPDIVVVCDTTKLDEKGCKGSPDLVIEVLSPATAKKDRYEKFRLYEQAKIREYWIVDPLNRFVEAYSLEDGKYPLPAAIYEKGDQIKVGVLEDCIIDLNRVFREDSI